MAGNNTGIMQNSGALSTNAIKDVENSVLESNGAVAYLDENNELCIAISQGVSLLKDLAWDNAYELTEENNVYVKKAYKKNSLNSFYLKDTFTKTTLSGTWAVAGGSNEPAEPATELEGSGSEYYATAPSVLSFRSTAPLAEFQEVQVNGETVDPQNYTLEEGSTIVKFTVDFLKTLGEGTHEVSIVSQKQIAKGDFKIKSPELNEYGFYYNKPYSCRDLEIGDPMMSTWINGALIFKEDNTASFLDLESQNILEGIQVQREGNKYSFTFYDVNCSGTFSADGKVFNAAEASIIYDDSPWGFGAENWYGSIDFTLDTESIAADDEYYYIHSIWGAYDDNGEWIDEDVYDVFPIDRTKLTYGTIRTNINGKRVIGLANGAFARTEITEIEIPKGIEAIRAYAFNECPKLTNVTIPDGITTIEVYAFQNCTALKNIQLPASVRKIGDGAFDGTGYYRNNANWTNNVLYIGDHLIQAKAALSGTCTVKPGTKVIAERAFAEYNNKLSGIVLPDGLEYIGDWAFDCPNLTGTVRIPANCVVDSFAFSDCGNITELILEEGVDFGFSALDGGGSKLTKLTIAPGVVLRMGSLSACGNVDTVIFTGTKAQYELIDKRPLEYNTKAAYVQCTDGNVALKHY